MYQGVGNSVEWNLVINNIFAKQCVNIGMIVSGTCKYVGLFGAVLQTKYSVFCCSSWHKHQTHMTWCLISISNTSLASSWYLWSYLHWCCNEGHMCFYVIYLCFLTNGNEKNVHNPPKVIMYKMNANSLFRRWWWIHYYITLGTTLSQYPYDVGVGNQQISEKIHDLCRWYNQYSPTMY